MAFILASASPRRRELMGLFHLPELKIVPSPWEEDVDEPLPEQRVMAIARGKAEAVRPLCGPEDTILAADTLVFLDGTPLGKPRDEAEAAAMLSALSGRTHTVCTGCCLLYRGKTELFAETTEVTFRPLTGEEIAAYIATGEPLDKAGAYGVQGRGALFITRLNGDFYNVMGLPVCALGQRLGALGIPH